MLLPLLLAPLLLQAAPLSAKERELAGRLDDYLQRSAAFGFSGSVLVAVGDRVILAKGYGVADHKTGAPCTPQTIFDLGSLSKQFTASTVLALEQGEVLRLEDTLAKFFDELPADKRPITLHQLLTHTSGLARGLPTIGSATSDRDAFLRVLMAAPLEARPGARFSYSNLGYQLLAAVVEQATGRPFEVTMKGLIFEPAGLASTGFRRDGVLEAVRSARGAPDGLMSPPPGSSLTDNPILLEGWGDERLLATEGWYSWGLRGAGGVLSTVEDLWKWEQALRGSRILQTSAQRKLFKPLRERYACGWYVLETEQGRRRITHGGDTDNGFHVHATRLPDTEAFVVTLGNLPGVVPGLQINLERLVNGDKIALPPEARTIPADQLAARAGDFEASPHGLFRLSVEDGAWMLEARDAEAFALLQGEGPEGSKSLLARSREIVKGFAGSDFRALHAAEDKARRLSFMEGWWKDLLAAHGALQSAVVLGATGSGTNVPVIVRLEFERGTELLTLRWNSEILSGVNSGPPYPSRVRLVPLSESEAVAHDLATGRTTVRWLLRGDGRTADLEMQSSKVRLQRQGLAR